MCADDIHEADFCFCEAHLVERTRQIRKRVQHFNGGYKMPAKRTKRAKTKHYDDFDFEKVEETTQEEIYARVIELNAANTQESAISILGTGNNQ
jgi:hypothetical protein